MAKPARPRREVTEELLAAERALSAAAAIFHGAVADQRGLSAIEEKSLALLERHGPLTAGELALQSGLAPPSITGLIDRLQKKGYVKRVADPADGRRVRVQYLQERGAELAPLLSELVTELEALAQRFSVEELEAITRFLNETARCQQACASKLSESKRPSARPGDRARRAPRTARRH